MSTKIIICIPGIWDSHQELVSAIAMSNSGYLYAGSIISNSATNSSAEVEHFEYDEAVSTAFRRISLGRFDEDELEKIDHHKSVIYLTCEAGSVEAVSSAMIIAQTLLKAGGISIKIETTGVSHPREGFLSFSPDFAPSLYKAFVVMVGLDGAMLSCGMHNFAKAEVTISNEYSDAQYTADTFSRYQIEENPEFFENQTFSPDVESDRFFLRKHDSSEHYEEDDLYFNPYGVWELEREILEGE